MLGALQTVRYAGVAKLVDALDLGSSAARRESSSLSFRTIIGNGSRVAKVGAHAVAPLIRVLQEIAMQVSIETTSGLERD